MKLEGKSALGVGLVAGALAGLAMPPLDWLPLAVVGLVVYVRLWEGAPTWKVALLRGLAWGTGHFIVGSYWIVEAFFVPPAQFELLGPPMVLCLAIVLGSFPAMAAGASRWLALRWPHLAGRYRRLILLAIAWTIAEWLRGHVFTGDPWNPLGHVWSFSSALLQSAAVYGVWGLTTMSFLVLAAPTAGWRASMAALLLVGAAGTAGLSVMPPVDEGASGPIVRLVQPNTPQVAKWDRATAHRLVDHLLEMSRRPGFDRLAAVVWPETAVPYLISPKSPLLRELATAAPQGGYLMAGAERAGGESIDDGIWNSLLAIDPAGALVAYYDKVHLVPFGEYIPFNKDIAPLSGLVGRGSFDVGESRMTLDLKGLPSFSPIICYEAIFPGAVTGPGPRPQWLVNITNDAWFGVSSGPYQHLTSARLRTIEEGLPMLRAANTGVSAVIDAYGRILAALDMEREGVIDHVIPAARSPTPYSRWHDWTLLALLACLSLPLFGRKIRQTV
jgi:apolipoprotein N-acyltransferase